PPAAPRRPGPRPNRPPPGWRRARPRARRTRTRPPSPASPSTRPPTCGSSHFHRDGAVGAGQPQRSPAFAGGGAPAGGNHVDPAGPQTAVAPAQPLPLGAGDGQADVGGDVGAAGDDENSPPLPGPGGETAGIAVAH